MAAFTRYMNGPSDLWSGLLEDVDILGFVPEPSGSQNDRLL